MKKTSTKLWLRVFAAMTLMLATSFAVHATSFKLIGSHNGWNEQTAVAMTESNGVWTCECAIEANGIFKVFDSDDQGDNRWYGYYRPTDDPSNQWSNATSIPWTFHGVTRGQGVNMSIAVAGTYRFAFNPSSGDLEVTPTPRPVVVKTSANGTVSVDKSTAAAGETVTVTVTPATGYYAESSNVDVELTIDPGMANAPSRAPTVGDIFHPTGDGLATPSAPGVYTFVMPVYPFGVEVSANFQQSTPLTAAMFEAIANQDWTGNQIAPVPGISSAGQAAGLTLNDVVVTYGTNVTGTGTVTITGKGKFTGTVTLNFTIVRPNLYLIGSFNGWNTQDGLLQFVEQQDGSFKLNVTSWPAGVSFKCYDGSTYYGADQAKEDGNENYWITEGKLGVAQLLKTPGDAMNFYMPVPGDWTITVDANWSQMTVSGVWKYTVNLPTLTNGSVTATPNPAAAGATVTLNVTPAEGYELGSLEVFTAGDSPTSVTLTNNTFTMPASDVNVIATFTKIPSLTLRYTTDNWVSTTDVPFTKNNDGSWTIAGRQMLKGAAFKLIDENGEWYGANESKEDGNENYWITQEMLGNAQTLKTAGNAMNFYLPVAGIWTINVNAARNEMTVTGAWDYAITVNATGCTVTTSPADRASATELVTVNITAPAHTNGTVQIVDANNNPVAYDTTTSTFVMPFADVTVNVTYTTDTYAITLSPVSGDQGYALATNLDNLTAVPVGASVTVTVTPNNSTDFAAVGLAVTPDQQLAVFNNGDGTFTFEMPASNITVGAALEAILHGVVFDANRHWATYCGAYTVEAPDDVQVYVVTGVANGEVQVQAYDYIPDHVGVLLYSETPMSNITAPLRAAATETITSPLVGVLEQTNISNAYVLYNDVFIRSEAGALAAHRCYIPAQATQSTPSGAPRVLKIARPSWDSVVTGVEGIDASQVAAVKYVNMNGMTSDKPFSGINVMVITRTDGTTVTRKVIK